MDIFKKIALLLIMVLLTHCTSLKQKPDSSSSVSPVSEEDLSLFTMAFQNMEAENYNLAIPIFEQIAHKYPGQELEWAALFNLASSYKALDLCEKSVAVYQKLLSKNTNQDSLKPRLYLSLSYAYECLGQSKKSLKALQTGQPYISQLTNETQLIEYPARMVLAYLNLGKTKQAKALEQKIYQNLSVLKQGFHNPALADKRFSQFFYTMGKSHVRTDKIQLKSFLKVFSYHQFYLSQSILMSEGTWSKQAEQSLGTIYKHMWARLKQAKNKAQHQVPIKKILKELKTIAFSSKNQKMHTIYKGLRAKTLKLL